MNIPLSNLPLFFLAFFCGSAMLLEAFFVVSLKMRIIPLPTKILYWISVGVVGKEQSAQRFAGKTTLENSRVYAYYALIFGTALLLSSFVYLNAVIS